MLKLTAGWPLMRAMLSTSRSRSTRVPRSFSVSARLPRRATTIWPKALGSLTRPSTRRMASAVWSDSRPTGWSLFASANALEISAGVTP